MQKTFPMSGPTVIVATVFLLAVYFIPAYWLSQKKRPFVPEGSIVVQLIKPFYKEGNAVVAPEWQIPQFMNNGDNPKDIADHRSTVLIFEDFRQLGPSHNSFYDIHQLGAGRYAHWNGTGIVFSASDNSDPNTNGRAYWVVQP